MQSIVSVRPFIGSFVLFTYLNEGSFACLGLSQWLSIWFHGGSFGFLIQDSLGFLKALQESSLGILLRVLSQGSLGFLRLYFSKICLAWHHGNEGYSILFVISLTFAGCQNRAKMSTYRPCSTPFKWAMTSVYDQIMAVRQTFQTYPTSDPLTKYSQTLM